MGSAPSKPVSKMSRRRHRRRKLRTHKRPNVELDASPHPLITSQRQSIVLSTKKNDDMPELDSISAASVPSSPDSIVSPTGNVSNEEKSEIPTRRFESSPPKAIKLPSENNAKAAELDSISGTSEKPIKPSIRFSDNTQKNTRLDRRSPVMSQRKASVDTVLSAYQDRSSSISHSRRNVKDTNAVQNNIESQLNSDQFDINNDHMNQDSLSSARSSNNKITRQLSVLTPIIVQPSINQQQESAAPEKTLPDIHKRATSTLNRENYRCKNCSHDQQSEQDGIREPNSSQSAWIMKVARISHININMDEYDEEAIQEKKILENDRPSNTYEYPPRLVVEMKKSASQGSTKYITLPAIARMGPKIVPTHTPFPNYDAFQRREQRLDKAYEWK